MRGHKHNSGKKTVLSRKEIVFLLWPRETLGETNAEAEDLSSASQSIIQVFVTRIRIDHPPEQRNCLNKLLSFSR